LPDGGRVETGTVQFRNHDLLSASVREMRRLRGADIALIPQDPLAALNPAFPVGRQASDALRLHRGLSRRAAEQEIGALLARMGIGDPGDVLRRYPHELSGGMRQRVLIAMAFSCAPALVIADEPTTALDVSTQAQILGLLETLRAEGHATTLFVTHDLGIVAHLAHRVAVMYAGSVVEVAPTAELFRAPAHPYTQRLLELVPRVDGRATVAAAGEPLMPTLAAPPTACAYRERCPRRFAACDEAMPALHTVASNRAVACHLFEPSV
jgi:oligopeptide/dipeptide ABC transporter ATP-binding protein